MEPSILNDGTLGMHANGNRANVQIQTSIDMPQKYMLHLFKRQSISTELPS